jgi:cytoskeletal protein RodZ
VVPNRCVANNKRKLYCIDAVYTHYKPQPLVATPASSGGKNHIWSVASAGNFQGEQPAVATAASTATATATLSGVLVDSTNVATCINTAERKLPAQTMTTVTPDAPPIAPTAAAAVAISSTAGMNTNQSPTPTATANGTTTTTTGHVLRYGDLVTFPLLHITPPTTLKAIVVQVYPADPADDDCAGKDKDEDKDEEDAQLVTVSTGPGERFTVPIHHLILIQPIAPMP